MAKTIVGELVDLYVKYGGNRADLTGKETTAEMIDAIEQIVGGSGSNDFVITYTQGEGDAYTADKTFAQIAAAYAAGKNLKAKMSAEGTDYCFTLVMMSSGENAGAAYFSAIVVESESVGAFTISHVLESDTETITLTNKTLVVATN